MSRLRLESLRKIEGLKMEGRQAELPKLRCR